MSDTRRAAKGAAATSDKHSTNQPFSGFDKNRNKIFTSGLCSCNVLSQPAQGQKLNEEPKHTEEESEAMGYHDSNMAEAAASDHMAAYLGHIAHLDMPLSAKIEMISALRQVMASFIDSAYGDDPVQHVHEMHAADEKQIPAVVSSGNTPENTNARLSSAFASPARGKRGKERS